MRFSHGGFYGGERAFVRACSLGVSPYTVRMDVYDFDGTLYRGDSTADFFLWCARRFPRIGFTLPRTGVAAGACLGLHVVDKTRFKGALYRFLPLVPDIDRQVERFWAMREGRICGPCHPHAGDVVVSASPEFLLRDVCARRGLTLIGSRVDQHTGRILSPNCSGEEKIVRFNEQFPGTSIDHFYSDSHNDDPMAAIAAEAFLVNVHQNRIQPWSWTAALNR